MGASLERKTQSPDPGEYLSVLRSRRYTTAIFAQTIKSLEIGIARKLVTIGDFKTAQPMVYKHPKLGSIDRFLFESENSFRRAFLRALEELPRQVEEKCMVPGFFAEVYGSVMWFLDRGASEGGWWKIIKDADSFVGTVFMPVAYDLVIDLDLKDNPWLGAEDGLQKVAKLCEFIVEKLGVEPTVLISKGVQLRASLLDIHIEYYRQIGEEKWPLFVRDTLPRVHLRIVRKLLSEFEKGHGAKVKFDEKMYDSARVTRLDLSLHSGIKAFSIPFTPKQLNRLSWDRVRELQKSPRYVAAIARRYSEIGSVLWGRVIDPQRYTKVLDFFMSLSDIDVKPITIVPRPRRGTKRSCGSWRKIVDPVLGEFEYDSVLEGWGWIEVLVKERIPIPDGRLSMCWYVLPAAIKGLKTSSGKVEPIITKEEAIEWLRTCLEKYPDPEKRLEDYIEKLDDNLEYDYNAPTWQALITEVSKDGKRLHVCAQHVKYPVLLALHEAGYVRLSDEQLRKIKEELGESE